MKKSGNLHKVPNIVKWPGFKTRSHSKVLLDDLNCSSVLMTEH